MRFNSAFKGLNPVGERNLDRSLQLENGKAEEGILLK
jgi:hypothetical protein